MKVRLQIEMEPQTAYDLAMWLHTIRYRDLPVDLPVVQREALVKQIRQFRTQILNTEVEPNERNDARYRDPLNKAERSSLVDWISGIR